MKYTSNIFVCGPLHHCVQLFSILKYIGTSILAQPRLFAASLFTHAKGKASAKYAGVGAGGGGGKMLATSE